MSRENEPAQFYDPSSSPSSSDMAERADLENQDKADMSRLELTRTVSNAQSLHRIETLTEKLKHRRSHRSTSASSNIDDNDFNLERILRENLGKSEEQGIHQQRIGLMMEHVNALGIDQSTAYAPTLGSTLNIPYRIYKAIKGYGHKKYRVILSDVEGLVEKGEMLLVLGRPGAGCSSYLRCGAGEVDQFSKVEGLLMYDGVPQDVVKKHFSGDIIYVGEMDYHFPHLNVEETLEFSTALRTPRTRLDMVKRSEYIDTCVRVLATVFGLTHTYKTQVGNEYIRGVSGGERKRVTIAEALSTRASIVSWDNATRGLDSSTALEYTQAIRAATNILGNVAVVAIYQAGERIYELFDKVTILYHGRQIYFGPTERAKQYFVDMGFECPPRQTTAEFLTAITDPLGRFPRKGMEDKVPKTADEFVAQWKESQQYTENQKLRDTYREAVSEHETYRNLEITAKQDKMKRVPKRSPYITTFTYQFRMCVKRGFERILGDKAYYLVNVASFIAQALIQSSLFYNIPDTTQGCFSRGGILFFAILFNALSTMSEINHSFEQRPIVMKQKSYALYHASAEALSALCADFPIKILTAIGFDIILYFVANLNRTAGQFFYFAFFVLVTTLIMTVFFQGLAAITTDIQVANSFAGMGVLILAIYTGYVVPRPSMHGWSKWISWINPISYGFENLMTNEFHGRRMECANLIPYGGNYTDLPLVNKVCPVAGSRIGQSYVLGDDYLSAQYGYKFTHIWRNFGILCGFWAFFVFILTISTEYLRPIEGGGDVLLFKRGSKIPEIEGGYAKEAEQEKAEQVTKGENPANKTDQLQDMNQQDISKREIFAWKEVVYTIPIENGHRTLLDHVQGYVKPGTLTALMGESGAGKTTLLNVLAQRVDFGVITGDMLVNGKPLDITFRRRTGYVQQQDIHVAESTVREALRFSADLRRPASVSRQEKYDYVETILGLLDMLPYADALVGSFGRGLNVEQRKKLSIGVELVAKPDLLLFLDEPTSGLDSQSAWAIVVLLRQLASTGQAILCTIHQPSATLFEEFDRLLLLKKGGQTVYFGDIGKNSETVVSYFERQGAPKCSPSGNPAEYVLECIGAGATAVVKGDWHQIWENSKECKDTTREIEDLIAKLKPLPDQNSTPELRKPYAASWFFQFRVNIIRYYTVFWRSPGYLMAKLGLNIGAGLFIGFTFWKTSHDISGLQQLLFSIFMSIVICNPLINQMQPRFMHLRDIFEVRENESNTYHWSILLLVQILTEIPWNFLGCTIFYLCFYFTAGFSYSTVRAGYHYLIYGIMFPLFYSSFGLMCAAIAPDAASASILTVFFFSFLIAFCGVLQPSYLMPGFWRFMWRVSPLTYIVDSLLSNGLHDRPVRCNIKEYNYLIAPDGMTCSEYLTPFVESATGYFIDAGTVDGNAQCGYCQYKVGDEFLEGVGMSYSHRWRNLGLLFAYVGFNFSLFLILFYLFRIRRLRLNLNFLKKMKKPKAKKSIKDSESENEKASP